MIAGLDRQVTPGVAQHDRLMEIDQGFEGRIMGHVDNLATGRLNRSPGPRHGGRTAGVQLVAIGDEKSAARPARRGHWRCALS